MNDTPGMSGIPAAAIAAAIDATDAYAREHLVVVSQVGYRRGVMDAALTAAAPHIDTTARASERERIRQLAISVEATTGDCNCGGHFCGTGRDFADLIADGGDQA